MVLLWGLQRAQSHPHLNFPPLASRTGREWISMVLSYPIGDSFEWQPWETNTLYSFYQNRETLCFVHSLSHVRLFATPWTAVRQVSLSFTISWSLLRLMSIDLMMPSNYLILCRPLLLLPSVFLSIRVFSNELALLIRWSKYWSFSFSISPSNEYSGLISFRIDWFDLLAVSGLSRVFSSTTIQSISSSVLSLLCGPTLIFIYDYCKNHSFDYVDLCRQSDVSAF